jgi:hypothetical protein
MGFADLRLYSDVELLRRVVLVFVLISCSFWFAATVAYMPYVLFMAPSVPENPDDENSQRLPHDPYFEVTSSVVVVVCALFVDFLLIAGIYKPYLVDRDMFYPWLGFYAAFVPLMLVVTVLKVTLSAAVGPWVAAPALLAGIYLLAYLHVATLFVLGGRKTANTIKAIQLEALQPLAALVTQA